MAEARRTPDDVVTIGAPDDVVAIARRAPDDVVAITRRAPDDVVAITRRAPDDVVAVARCAPDDVVAVSAAAVGAPDDVVAITRRTPDDVVAVARRAPDNVVAVAGAPDDVAAAIIGPARCAPDDVVAVVGDFRRSPEDARFPRVRRRQHQAAGQLVVAPDEVLAPHRLDRNTLAFLGRRVEAREPHGAERVQETGALLERAVAAIFLRRVLEDRLEQVGRERRVRLQHLRGDAAHDRRGLAGAAQDDVRERIAGRRARHERKRLERERLLEQRAALHGRRFDADATGEKIGLRVEQRERRAARAERGAAVVLADKRALRAVRADGEHPREGAGLRDATPHVALVRGRVALRMRDVCAIHLADVAGRRDDENVGVDELLGRNGQQIAVIRVEHRRQRIRIRQRARGLHAEGEVDDLDVIVGRVVEHPLERVEHAGDRAGAVGAEHAQREDRRAGRHPGLLTERIEAAAGDRSGDVGAVTIGVAGRGAGRMRRVRRDEVLEKGNRDLAVRRDARIENRDTDAGAVEAQHLTREECAALHTGSEIESVNAAVVVGVERARVRRDRFQLAVGDIEHEAVHQTEADGPRVFPELRRQRSLDAEDDAGRLRCRRGAGAVVQFVVEFGVFLLGGCGRGIGCTERYCEGGEHAAS